MNLISSVFLRNKHKEIWLWPPCKHPKTLSFRATTKDSLVEAEVDLRTLESCFTNSSESASISMESEKYFDQIVRGARSERLFFEPDSTSSISETRESCRQYTPVEIGGDGGGVLPYKESVAVVVDSENPYGDFKKSMEEMVENHELKDWDCLEELLGWYLRMNGKNNHEFIVGAFIDLLAGISGGGGDGGCRHGDGGGVSFSDQSTASFTSAASTFSSPISSPLSQAGREKIIEKGKMDSSMFPRYSGFEQRIAGLDHLPER